MARLAALAAVCVLVYGHAVAARELLQDSCVAQASNAASGPCQQFLAWQSELPEGSPTDAQLQAFLATQSPPSTACCADAGPLVTDHCQCDPTVQEYSALYNLTPSSLVTFARTAKMACGPAYIAANVNPYCGSPTPSPGEAASPGTSPGVVGTAGR